MQRSGQFGQLNDARAYESLKKVEESLNKIDLLGNEKQIEILKKIKNSLNNKDAHKNFTDLQNALREALRKELELEDVESSGGGIIISKNN